MSSGEGTGESNAHFDAALERIFHPDRFDIKQLNAAAEGDVDEGKFYHAASDAAGNGNGDSSGSGHEENGASGDREAVSAVRPFQRSISVLETPVADVRFRRGATQGSFQDHLRTAKAHYQDSYPHPHHVLHRVKSSKKLTKTPLGSSKANVDLNVDTIVKSTVKSTEELTTAELISVIGSAPAKLGEIETIPCEATFELGPTELYQHDIQSRSAETNDDSPSKRIIPAFSIGPFDSEVGIIDSPSVYSPFSHQDSVEMDKKVSFFGLEPESFKEQQHLRIPTIKKKPKKRHKYDPVAERQVRGSDLPRGQLLSDDEGEELSMLANRDVDGMASHRTDQTHYSSRRHASKKGRRRSDVTMFHVHEANLASDKMSGRGELSNHSPRDLFVEMDELTGEEWVEQARWIKYEEDREEGAERWGKAHISTLVFHSLIDLRICLESGIMILDMEAQDFPGIVYRVVEDFSIEGIIAEHQKAAILRVLLLRHKYVSGKSFSFNGIRRNMSQKSLNEERIIQMQEVDGEAGADRFKWLSSLFGNQDNTSTVRSADSVARKHKSRFNTSRNYSAGDAFEQQNLINWDTKTNVHISKNQTFIAPRDGNEALEMTDNSPESKVDGRSAAQSKKESILSCLREGTEGTITLVGSLEGLQRPAVAFVRLVKGIVLPNALEIPLPVRFVFVLLTPKPSSTIDCHEVGRAFSTLMSNPTFKAVCYKIKERRALLNAINEFLGQSVVLLPPGQLDSQRLLSVHEIHEIRKRQQKWQKEYRRKEMLEEEGESTVGTKEEKEKKKDDKHERRKHRDPLVRTKRLFGGLVDDIKWRYPHYWSDIRDGFNMQCLSTAIFIYFACLSGAVAFGGLYGDKTDNLIGIPLTLIVSCVAGIVFSLFAGTPLIIIGVTGPVLLFDEALFGFATGNHIEFLSWRVWTAFWVVFISLVVAAFQGSTLVKHFTKFTKDIFAALVALIYIFEALKKLSKIFKDHPLTSLEIYCNSSSIESSNRTTRDIPMDVTDEAEYLFENITSIPVSSSSNLLLKNEPNTALLSFILMFGTFLIAYYLRIFRNGKYLGRMVRRALGDFGVPIAIIVMVSLDYVIDDTYTQKLNVPSGLRVTSPDKRGWFIPPQGLNEPMPVWAVFAAIIPALLLYLLLFMETQICQLLMLEKATKKGGGLHWDIVLLCSINAAVSLVGGPWVCAATVRAVSHVSALSVMSTTHAPGETAKVVDVLDQRMTGLSVSIMLGLSVLLSPVLRLIPYPVLFGVFIYMGVSAIYGGIQFFDRVFLLFMPVKHHPQVSYVRRVKTWKMNLFTFIQLFGLAILWTVKSIQAVSLFFPFFVVAMIPLRMSLKIFFSPKELNALDGPKAGQTIKEEEPDFYDQAYGS